MAIDSVTVKGGCSKQVAVKQEQEEGYGEMSAQVVNSG